jgi:hypothetical protein
MCIATALWLIAAVIAAIAQRSSLVWPCGGRGSYRQRRDGTLQGLAYLAIALLIAAVMILVGVFFTD